MTYSRLALIGSSFLILSACGAAKSAELTDLLKNPLYAEQYYDAQTEHMVDLLINSGALLKDESIKSAIDKTRLEGVRLAKEATSLQAKGKMGVIMSDTSEAGGEVLLLNGVLYLGPEFLLSPSVNVHVYLSSVLDPRDGVFPDETAVDIGPVNTTFGATSYNVAVDTEHLRTFVLYDNTLKRILGFSQLQTR